MKGPRELSEDGGSDSTTIIPKRQKATCSYCQKTFYLTKAEIINAPSLKYKDLKQLSTKLNHKFCSTGPCKELFRFSNPHECYEIELPVVKQGGALTKPETEDLADRASHRSAVLAPDQLSFHNTLFELFSLDLIWDLFQQSLTDREESTTFPDEVDNKPVVIQLGSDCESFDLKELVAAMKAVESLMESTCRDDLQGDLLNKLVSFLNSLSLRQNEATEGALHKLLAKIPRIVIPVSQHGLTSQYRAGEDALHFFGYMFWYSVIHRQSPAFESAEDDDVDAVYDRIDTIIDRVVDSLRDGSRMIELNGFFNPTFHETKSNSVEESENSEKTPEGEAGEEGEEENDEESSGASVEEINQNDKYLSIITLDNLSQKIDNVVLRVHMPGPKKIYILELNILRGNAHLDQVKFSKIRKLIQEQFLSQPELELPQIYKQDFGFIKKPNLQSKDDFIDDDRKVLDLYKAETKSFDIYISRQITLQEGIREGDPAQIQDHSSLRISTFQGEFNLLYKSNHGDRKFFDVLVKLGLVSELPGSKILDKPISTTLKEVYSCDSNWYQSVKLESPAEQLADQGAPPGTRTLVAPPAPPETILMKLRMNYDINEALMAFMSEDKYTQLRKEVREEMHYPRVFVVNIPGLIKPAVAEILLNAIQSPCLLIPKNNPSWHFKIKSMVLNHGNGMMEVLKQPRNAAKNKLYPSEPIQLISSISGLRNFTETDISKIIRITYERTTEDI